MSSGNKGRHCNGIRVVCRISLAPNQLYGNVNSVSDSDRLYSYSYNLSCYVTYLLEPTITKTMVAGYKIGPNLS